MKRCPYCAEEIQEEAIKCKHCGEFLRVESKEAEKTVSVKLNPNEANEIVYLGKPSHLNYFATYLIGGLLLLITTFGLIVVIFNSDLRHKISIIGVIFYMILSSVILLYGKIVRAFTEYKITNYTVSTKRGILRQEINEIPVKDIQFVKISRTFMDRIFNLGDVDFASAGTAGIEITFHGVKDPEKVRNIAENIRKQK